MIKSLEMTSHDPKITEAARARDMPRVSGACGVGVGVGLTWCEALSFDPGGDFPLRGPSATLTF